MEETAGSSEGRRPRRSSDGKGADAVPGYLRPSAGSCHHVCKYGGAHTFEERDARSTRAAAQPRPRRQQQPVAPEVSQRTTAAPGPALAKLRSASSRRRVGDLIKLDKAGKLVPAIADAGKKDAGAVVWKDIVAYESSPRPEKITVAGDVVKTKGATKGKKSSHGRVKIIPEQVDDIAADKKQPDGSLKKKKKLISSVGSKLTGKPSPPEPKAGEMATPPPERKKTIKSSKSIKPPKLKKNLIEIQDKGGGEEIVLGDAAAAAAAAAAASNIKEERSHNNLSQEEKPGRAPMAAAHRRAKSMSITSSKSVRFPFTRQASRTSAAFKVVRSKSTRAPATASPEEEDNEKPATRLRFIRRGDAGGSSGGGSIQLRIRSLRRRGSSSGLGAAAATAGFVVPAVALRHQKTLENKRSRRLYNSVIEETAGKLAKARKSRVKALVGAFESLISKIGK